MKHVLAILTMAALCLFAAADEKPKQKPLMKDFMGINGHFKFKPELYKQTCRLVRNYHNLSWDYGNRKPSELPTFPMAANKVNWNKHVYGKWQKHGFEMDASIMFAKSDGKDWAGDPKAAYAYGKAFAAYFGPSGKNRLLTSAEIGNEPVNVSDEDYRKIFEQMAKGLRAGDPKLKILTGTTAVTPDKWSKAIKLFDGLEDLYDVINVHKYPAAEGWPTWKRSYPEDPAIDYLKVIQDVIDWRDKNAKGKEVWITEFGYDACTDAAMQKRKKPFERWQDVSDEHQAQWIVRSFLVFATMDLERAYLYFFNDSDQASTHAAAGLTRNFKPKPSFYAVAHLYRSLGEYRLRRVLSRKQNGIYALEFSPTEKRKGRVWVLWHATGTGKEVDFRTPAIPGEVRKVEQMPLVSGPAPKVKWEPAGRGIHLSVTESPTYIWID